MKTIRIRASTTTFIIFSAIYSLFLAVGLWVTLHEGAKGIFVILFGALIIYGPILAYKLSWNENEIIYREPFKYCRIETCDLVSHEFDGPTHEDLFQSMSVLSLFARSGSFPAMSVHVGTFAKKDIREFLKFLDRQIANNKPVSH